MLTTMDPSLGRRIVIGLVAFILLLVAISVFVGSVDTRSVRATPSIDVDQYSVTYGTVGALHTETTSDAR
jgi:hypothetical protein